MKKLNWKDLIITILGLLIGLSIIGCAFWYTNKGHNKKNTISMAIINGINRASIDAINLGSKAYIILTTNSPFSSDIASSINAKTVGAYKDKNYISPNIPVLVAPTPPTVLIKPVIPVKNESNVELNIVVNGLFYTKGNDNNYAIIGDDQTQSVVTKGIKTKWGEITDINAEGVVINGKIYKVKKGFQKTADSNTESTNNQGGNE